MNTASEEFLQNTEPSTNAPTQVVVSSLITEEERNLLDKLVSEPTQLSAIDIKGTESAIDINNRDGRIEGLNIETKLQRPLIHKVEKSLSSSDITPVKPTIVPLSRVNSSDTVMRKSALSQKDRSKPRVPKCVTFVEGTPYTDHEQALENNTKKSTEVDKLQKELDELRKKLNDIKPHDKNNDIVVDLPQISDDTPIADIIGLVATKLNLSMDIIKQDFEIMNKSRIKDVHHLKLLMNNEQLWKDFELPILEKCAIEHLLGKDAETSSSWFLWGIAAFVPVALTGLLFNNPTTTKLLRFFEDLFEI